MQRQKRSIGDVWKKGRYLIFKGADGHRKYVHRHVMEQAIGRTLIKGEMVHHKDGNPLNNDIANLQIVTRGEHNGLHPRAAFCGKKHTKEAKEKIRRARTGATCDAKTKRKISGTLKGRPSPNKGKVMSEEQKEKIRQSVIKARKEKFWSSRPKE